MPVTEPRTKTTANSDPPQESQMGNGATAAPPPASRKAENSSVADSPITHALPAPFSDETGPALDAVSLCPACDSRESTVLFAATDRTFSTTSRVFQIVECARCRLIRLEPQPAPEELSELYPEGYWDAPEATVTDRLEQWYRRFVLTDHARFVESALGRVAGPGMVLDVGCGAGLFLEILSHRLKVVRTGRRVVGLDFSLDAAVAATAKQVPAVCATLSHAPFAPESCAAITMFNVLQHLYDPASYLDAAHRLLARDGRLIVQVPNAACWQFLLMGERWSGLDVPRNLFHFRLSDLEALLGDCGFKIVRYKHFSLRDNPAGLAASLAPMLDPTVRRLRSVPETPQIQIFKDALYVAMVAVAVPVTLLEAACRAGSTVMLEARKK